MTHYYPGTNPVWTQAQIDAFQLGLNSYGPVVMMPLVMTLPTITPAVSCSYCHADGDAGRDRCRNCGAPQDNHRDSWSLGRC